MQQRTVLVVDDEDFFRQTVIDALNEWSEGVVGVGAANGEEALAIIAAGAVDVIVTDLHMPVMNGFELLKELLNRACKLPVIVMTAHGTPDIDRWVTATAAFAFFEKPIDLPELLAAVQRLLVPSESGHLEGVTLPGLCQLLQIERKTCEIRVRSEGKSGRLLFVEGALVDAVHEDAQGNAAAMDVMSWPDPTVVLAGRVPPRYVKRVTENVTFLIMDAARVIDERARPDQRAVGRAKREPPPRRSTPMANPRSLPGRSPSVPPPSPQTTFRSPLPNRTQRNDTMATIGDCLKKLAGMDGFVAAALVDAETGMLLGTEGNTTMNLELAAAANTEVVRAKRKAIEALGLDDNIEDILITLGKQYHLIRPMKERPMVFFYVALDRAKANLGLARLGVAEAEKSVKF